MKDKIAEAQVLLEDVLNILDVLVERGDGTTDENLYYVFQDLLKFRGIFDQMVLGLRLNKIEIKTGE